MPLLWNDCIKIGIEEIDQQHQELVALVNGISRATRAGEHKGMLVSLFDGLIDEARTHFATEEHYFNYVGYPWLDEHKQEHDVFLSKIVLFKNSFAEGRIELTTNIVSLLEDWLMEHIIGMDMQFSSFVKDNRFAVADMPRSSPPLNSAPSVTL